MCFDRLPSTTANDAPLFYGVGWSLRHMLRYRRNEAQPAMLSHKPVIISDPTARPELVHAAATFAQSVERARYISPIAIAKEGTMISFFAGMPGSFGSRIARQLQLRSLPTGIDPKAHESAAGMLELLLVGARKANVQGRPLLTLRRFRDHWFDFRVSKKLRRSDGVVLASAGAAKATLRRSRELNIRSVLNCPIADHRFARSLLEEEASLVPDFAQTLQFPSRTPSMDRWLETELSLADHILTYSSFHRDSYISMGIPAEKMLVVPLGVDTDAFCPGDTRPKDDIFRVIFVGQLSQRKGLSYLLDGFTRSALPNSELVLAGRVVGTDAPWIGTPNVKHIGHLPRSALPDAYRSADVFVMPSLVEGFCLTALEALACGLPSLVTPNTFGDDVVRDGIEGFMLPIRDSEAISERLRYLYENRDVLARMKSAARHRAESYSWQAYDQRLADIFRTRVLETSVLDPLRA
jgi:alpha-maltose-1-phosphate synthase